MAVVGQLFQIQRGKLPKRFCRCSAFEQAISSKSGYPRNAEVREKYVCVPRRVRYGLCDLRCLRDKVLRLLDLSFLCGIRCTNNGEPSKQRRMVVCVVTCLIEKMIRRNRVVLPHQMQMRQ